jgi:hypothetical protein
MRRDTAHLPAALRRAPVRNPKVLRWVLKGGLVGRQDAAMALRSGYLAFCAAPRLLARRRDGLEREAELLIPRRSSEARRPLKKCAARRRPKEADACMPFSGLADELQGI